MGVKTFTNVVNTKNHYFAVQSFKHYNNVLENYIIVKSSDPNKRETPCMTKSAICMVFLFVWRPDYEVWLWTDFHCFWLKNMIMDWFSLIICRFWMKNMIIIISIMIIITNKKTWQGSFSKYLGLCVHPPTVTSFSRNIESTH